MKSILFYTFLFFSISVYAQVDTSQVEVKKYSIDSKSLETERNYWVSLPSNYDSTNTYPVMYVLDAEWRFGITNALEKELSEYDKIPAHIVVGITHPNRRRDMTFSTTEVKYTGELDTISYHSENSGNGLKFLNFIEDELIQEINLKYSTSGFNILIGHSIGGYFCSYIAPIQKSFRSLQIYDPSIWYSEGEAINHIDSDLSKESSNVIFLSSSSNFENQFAYHHKKIEKLHKSLKRFPNIRVEYKSYSEETHNSMYLHSFLDGMAMLYDGYEMRIGGWDANVSALKIVKHFEKFSEEIRFEFAPPIDLFLNAGVTNYFQGNYEDCIEALEVFLYKNPEHLYALQLMGDAYYVLDDKQQSLSYYSKAFEDSPEDLDLKRKIDNLIEEDSLGSTTGKTVADSCVWENISSTVDCRVCYFGSSNLIKSRQTIKKNESRIWAIREKFISWDEDGEIFYKQRSKSTTIDNWGEVFKKSTILWVFREKGKRVLRRSKTLHNWPG